MKFAAGHHNLIHKGVLIFTNRNFARILNMKVIFKPYLIYFLLMAWLPALASNPPETVVSERAAFSFRFDPGKADHPNNYFVKELARYNFLNLYTTQYNLDYDLEVKITKASDGSYALKASIPCRSLDGDVLYKDFRLDDVLMPTLFSFDLELKNQPDNSIHFENMAVSGENIRPVPETIPGSAISQDFRISNVEFSYHPTDRDNFDKRISGINRFMGFNELLTMNLEKARQVNPNTRDSVLAVFVEIYDLSRFRDTLNRFEPPFDIPDKYAGEMQQNRKALNANLRRLHTIFKQNTDTLRPQLSQQQYDLAAETLIALQKDYLRAMNHTSHFYEPVFQEVTGFFETRDGWNQLDEALENALFTKAGTVDAETSIADFVYILQRHYTSACDSLIKNEQFTEADLFATSARTFCEVHPDLDCDIATFNRLAQTRYGIFDSYLRVAQSAMENNNPDFSYQYLRLARDFQRRNSSYIITPAAVDQALEKLAWKYVEAGEAFYDDEKYAEALPNYVSAQEIYHEIGGSRYLDFIDQQIEKCVNRNNSESR